MDRSSPLRSPRWEKCVSLTLFFALFLRFFCCCPAAAFSREATPATVKIGYYYDGDYMYKSSDGTYRGYDVEYFYEIAKYTNWDYEFVDYDSFEAASAALEAGQVDVVPAFFYSEERAQKFIFSASDMGSIYVTLIVPAGDTAHSYNDYDSFAGMRVGVLAGSLDGEEFRSWAAEKKLSLNIVDVHSTDELFSELGSGQIDAIAISYLGASSDYRVVAEFSPMQMFFAMPKANTALMQQLNAAMEQIAIVTPSFKTSLYNKYYLVNQQQVPVFTRQEKAFIAQNSAVNVALPINGAPYSFAEKGGQPVGAIPDLFAHISALSGLKFKLIAVSSQEEAVAGLQAGKFDIIGKFTNDVIGATAQNIRLTNPYMEAVVTQVTRKGTNEIHSIAVPSSLASLYTESADGDSAIRVLAYSSPTDCFSALKRGEVDAAFLDTNSTNYLLNVNRASDYSITALNGCTLNISMGLIAQGSNTLYAILNKCIRFTSAATMNELIINYSQAGSDSFGSFIDRIPPVYLIVFFVILFAAIVILVVLVLTLRRRAREERLLTEQSAALRAAEKASDEKTEFLGNVSHDMRTPLNGILGFAELAAKSDDPAAVRDYLAKIRISGKLLLDLVNDTLTVSKLENQKFELHATAVRFGELIEDVVTPIRTAAETKGVHFTADVSCARDNYIRVDRLAWQKIFLNLLTNAVKFTPPEGTVEFTASDDVRADGKAGYVMTVRDTGIGIDENFLPKIFEPFSQERPAGLDNSGGTGLGLSIVKHFVDVMGGTIEVKSHKGEGSIFTVRLPAEPLPDYVPETETDDDACLENAKLLLCEDNEMNAEIVRSFLEMKHAEVVWARDGQEGVELFSGSAPKEFSAILMDIRMPVMNGCEAAAAIRALHRSDAESVPIIALSADAYEEDIQKSRAAGMNAHIAKPVDPKLLYRELCRFIGHTRLA